MNCDILLIMQQKRTLIITVVFSLFIIRAFSIDLQKNDLRIFAATANDKFSYGLSQNKDDQLTAAAELHFNLPYFFIDLYDNSITNRSFPGGRYDELILKGGTHFILFKNHNYNISLKPEAGFCILGNFGMGIAQNLNHKLSCVDEVNLDYEHFSNPFAPIINSIISFDYIPPAADFIKIRLELESDNIINYSTGQKLSVNTIYGKNTIFNLFAGYSYVV